MSGEGGGCEGRAARTNGIGRPGRCRPHSRPRTPTGASGLQAQLRDWLDQGVLVRVLQALLDADYDVCITSDHGNLEVRGTGRPNLGSIPDEQGERAGVFPTEEMRASSLANMSGGIVWPPHGLPPDYFPVLAPWDGAFIPDRFQLVSHGGITVDETIVPFVSLRRAP
ncbi:MAG: hypothetical protein M3O70_27965 [Actinomycetota bacterium]|nr:hypothetical protein [Actinomycetota bacterium]